MKRETSSVHFDTALSILKKGGVVAIPTETVYGLAGSALSEDALKKIFQIKKRPFFNPLIVHCFGEEQMRLFHQEKHPLLRKMINHFCPGPLTFVLDKTKKVHPFITAGHKKVGLRIPNHPLTLTLIEKMGTALCAPSANLFGQLSPTQAEHVSHIFGEQVFILDGGPCQLGIESTVLEPDFENRSFRILRPGSISKEELLRWLKKENLKNWEVKYASSSASPGNLKHHYQPEVPLIVIDLKKGFFPEEKKIESYLSKKFPKKIFKQLYLKNSPEITARTLYQELRVFSQNSSHIIYVCKRPEQSNAHWKAIWDRLDKACSQRFHWPPI